MKTFRFVPEATKQQFLKDKEGNMIPEDAQAEGHPISYKLAEPPKFSGYIDLKVPDFDQRMQLLEDIGLEINEEGEGVIPKGNKIKLTRKLVKATEPYYQAVAMEHIDGTKYATFEDLSCDNECQPILMEVCALMQRGIRPGKI